MTVKLSALALAICLAAAIPVAAQLPGSVAEERARLAEITGDSTLAPRARKRVLEDVIPALRRLTGRSQLTFRAIEPELRVIWNSAIPYSRNDGALWAGRGKNVMTTAGLGIRRLEKHGFVSLTIAPTIVYSQNLPFQVRPDSTPGRSEYASPFHHRPFSADLPLRFGDRHVFRIDPGQTALTVRRRGIVAGLTAENEVWGPGIRDQLVLSANAPGIPRFYVSTATPMQSRIGMLSGEFFTGMLSESLFFDDNAGNDLRSISGLLLRIRPAFDSNLTLGLERVVYRAVGPFDPPVGFALSHSLDALFKWEYIASPADTQSNGATKQRTDQMIAVFARWISPESGFEVYGEWARLDLPRSATEILTAAHHSLGYTFGLQWAQPRRTHDYLRLQTEFTNLEQSRVFADRPTPDFYAGRASLHGYTQRGQVIGAASGPGASSQWLAVDYFTQRWQLGTYVGRIRSENDALYREQIPTLFRHDVTVLTGLRGAWRSQWTDVSLDATFGYRFNYLFQNGFASPGRPPSETVDVRNFTVSLALSPR